MTTLILDQAAARGEQERQSRQQDMEQVFAREITAKVAPLLAQAPVWLKEIHAAAHEALKVVAKVHRTEWLRDQEIDRACREIETVSNQNPQSIQAGLELYKRLSWRSLLNQQGDYDVNAGANLRGALIPLLNVGRGAVNSIKDNVKRLLARIEYLEGLRRDQLVLPPEPGAGVSIVPPEPATKPAIIPTTTEMNARER